MTQSQPPITRTTHTLPFDKLAPRDFERLCLWLVEREGYERAEHLGAAGSEQGRDIVAWREGALWTFQCKRVRSFGPKDALEEVEKVLALPEAERPAGLVFLVACDASANTRQQVHERCAGAMECHFWAGTELDEKVKQHADILEEFFQAITGDIVHGDKVEGDKVLGDKIVYEGIKPVSATDLLDACQSQVESVLHDVRHKYDPKLYVNRAIERELNHFFDTPLDGPAPNCFLLVAPAGSGKTNLLCELARARVTQQPVLLLMGGNLYIGATTGLLGGIQAELEAASSEVAFRSAGDSLHTLHRLAEELDRDALLFLDAINEHDRPVPMRKAVEDLLRKTRGRRIKLVVTCRDYYWGLFKGRFWEGATVNDLPVEADEDEIGDMDGDFSRFAADEHERALPLYLDHYNITGRPVGDAAEQCRHPLLLRFFCEAYRGQDVGEVEDIRLKELFDRYWSQKLASIAQRMIQQGDERLQDALAVEVGDYLLIVAAHMLHYNVRTIPLAEMSQVTGREEPHGDPRSIYGRIRDEFIILEEKERGRDRRKLLQVAFVYEEFMEYIMARSLIRDWDRANLDEVAILAEIETLTGKYESFAQIVGVMVYLALMLKEERDLALWSLLLNRGEQWQKVVFEAFRKLPEEQLDDRVFDALGEMLAMGDESILVQVLDTLKVKRVGQVAPVSVMNAVCELATHEQVSICRRAVLALGNMEADLALPVLIRTLADPRSSVKEGAIVALKKLRDLRAVEPLSVCLRDRARRVQFWAIEALGELRDKRAVEFLIAVLKEGDENVQSKAAEALGKLGELTVEPLIAALKDDRQTVRQNATRALGLIWQLPDLIQLGSSNWSVRSRAAWALGQAGDTRAVGPLTAALKDDHQDVRQSATRALGHIWQLPALTELGDSNWRVRRGAAETLGGLRDTRAVEPLIAALKDSDESVWSEAALALGLIEDIAVASLIAALKDSDASVRQGSAWALGLIGEAQAVEPLIIALKDSDSSVRREAAKALGELGGMQAVKPLIAALKDSDASVRQGSAWALGLMGGAQAVEPLIIALKDSDSSVQWEAAKALGKLGQLTVEPLIIALKDSDSSVRREAAKALGELGEMQAVKPLITALKDSDASVRQKAAEALGKLGQLTVEPLIIALKDSDSLVRWEAAKALGKLGQLTVEPLIIALKDSDSSVRWEAAEALGKLGDTRAVEPLIATLKDSDWDVWQRAAEALGKLGKPAVEPLIAALKDSAGSVRRNAAEALGKLGDTQAVEPLIAALKDENVFVCSAAAQALGRIGNRRAVEPLIVALRDSIFWGEAQWSAAKALRKLGEPAGGLLIAALRDSDAHVRLETAQVLGKLGDVQAVEPLIAALRDSDAHVRLEAAEALGKLGDAQAVEPLIAALKDSYWLVRQSAAEALGQLGDARAVEPLIAALKGSDSDDVRAAAAGALGKLGDMRAVEPLITGLTDSYWAVRCEAAEALGKLEDRRAVERLSAALRDGSEEVEKSAAEALRCIGTPEALALVFEYEAEKEKRR